MFMLRRILTYLRNKRTFNDVFWYIGKHNVNCTTCFDTSRNTWQFYDVFLMVRMLKYGTGARFVRKSIRSVDETLPEPFALAKGFIDRPLYHRDVRTPWRKLLSTRARAHDQILMLAGPPNTLLTTIACSVTALTIATCSATALTIATSSYHFSRLKKQLLQLLRCANYCDV